MITKEKGFKVRRLIVYDVKARTKEEIGVATFLDTELKKILQRLEDIGIQINIMNLSDPERFVKGFFEKEGYDVLKTNPNKSIIIDLPIQKVLSYLELTKEDIFTSGVPDYLVYKRDGDVILDSFFVEVKKVGAGILPSQLDWIFTHPNVNIKYFYVEEIGGE